MTVSEPEPIRVKHLSGASYLGRILDITHKLSIRLERPARDKHSSLLGPFINFEESKVLI
jgi:hypothetical protein